MSVPLHAIKTPEQLIALEGFLFSEKPLETWIEPDSLLANGYHLQGDWYAKDTVGNNPNFIVTFQKTSVLSLAYPFSLNGEANCGYVPLYGVRSLAELLAAEQLLVV